MIKSVFTIFLLMAAFAYGRSHGHAKRHIDSEHSHHKHHHHGKRHLSTGLLSKPDLYRQLRFYQEQTPCLKRVGFMTWNELYGANVFADQYHETLEGTISKCCRIGASTCNYRPIMRYRCENNLCGLRNQDKYNDKYREAVEKLLASRNSTKEEERVCFEFPYRANHFASARIELFGNLNEFLRNSPAFLFVFDKFALLALQELIDHDDFAELARAEIEKYPKTPEFSWIDLLFSFASQNNNIQE